MAEVRGTEVDGYFGAMVVLKHDLTFLYGGFLLGTIREQKQILISFLGGNPMPPPPHPSANAKMSQHSPSTPQNMFQKIHILYWPHYNLMSIENYAWVDTPWPGFLSFADICMILTELQIES